jgi:hypothetical protein
MLEWAGVASSSWLACCCDGFIAGVQQGAAVCQTSTAGRGHSWAIASV